MNKFKKNVGLIVIVILSFWVLPTSIKAQNNQLEPIVLVPGIMGSWNWEKMLQRTGEGSWNFFPLDHSWDNMIDALEKSGYERDKTLFVAFYDWRQSNINSALDYIKPTINKALENSPTGKVDVIAHSMGGLAARRYIQRNDYIEDVDQLILLGTPNYGSSDVYTLWEGGVVPTNWETNTKNLIKFYLWYMTTATTQTSDNYDTIRTFVPSIGEMLPTYEFIKDSEDNLKPYWSLAEAQNPFLENLNSWSSTQKLQSLRNITAIAGKGEGTVLDIPVVERDATETKLWADGFPNPLPPNRTSTEGDNRVLIQSALLDEFTIYPPVPVLSPWQKLFAKIFPVAHAQFDPESFLNHIQIDSKHGDLPTTAISDVFTVLDLGQPTIAYVPPPEPDNITSFWFASPVQIKVTDPQGRSVTKESNEIPEAVYTGETDPNGVKMIVIPNGSSGQYKIELVGTENGEYHMAIAKFNDSGDDIVTVEKEIVTGEKVEYTVSVNPNSTTPTIISEPIVTPPDTEEPPTQKSAVELTESLISDLKNYYQDGKIKNDGVYQSLLTDLKISLKSLKESELTRPIGEKYPALHELKVKIAKKLAIIKLEAFVSKVKTQSSKGKIDKIAGTDMLEKAQNIISKIK